MGEIALQTSWGVPIALYLFLGGLAGGTALVSAVVQLRWGERFKNIVCFGAWAAALLLVAGVLCLVSEVTMPLRAMQLWVAFTNPASWMTIGAWLLVAGIAAFGLFALVATPAIGGKMLGENAAAAKKVLAIVSAVLGSCIALYTGILIGVLLNHPLWNSALVPALFTVSAFDTGVALISLYIALGKPLAAPKAKAAGSGTTSPAPSNAAFAVAGASAGAAAAVAAAPAAVAEGAQEAAAPKGSAELSVLRRLLEKSSLVLIVAELVVLAALLLTVSGSGEVGGLSVWILTAGPLAVPFWLVLVVLGLVVPLVIEGLHAFKPALVAKGGKALAVAAPALLLVGGLVLRFLILYAGLPLTF